MKTSAVPRLYEDVMDAWSVLYDEDPRTSGREWINLGYWDTVGMTYEAACDRMAEQLALLGGFDKNDRILDSGCGTGTSTRFWYDYVRGDGKKGCSLVGLNITPAHIDIANESIKGTHYDEHLEFVLGDATDMHMFEADAFTKVAALECAFHFDTREDFIREAFRVLKTGGILVTADILVKSWTPTYHRAKKYMPDIVAKTLFQKSSNNMSMPFENQVDIREHRRQLETAGFKNIRIIPINDFTAHFFTHYREKTQGFLKGRIPEWMTPQEQRHFRIFKKKMDFTNSALRIADYVLVKAEK